MATRCRRRTPTRERRRAKRTRPSGSPRALSASTKALKSSIACSIISITIFLLARVYDTSLAQLSSTRLEVLLCGRDGSERDTTLSREDERAEDEREGEKARRNTIPGSLCRAHGSAQQGRRRSSSNELERGRNDLEASHDPSAAKQARGRASDVRTECRRGGAKRHSPREATSHVPRRRCSPGHRASRDDDHQRRGAQGDSEERARTRRVDRRKELELVSHALASFPCSSSATGTPRAAGGRVNTGDETCVRAQTVEHRVRRCSSSLAFFVGLPLAVPTAAALKKDTDRAADLLLPLPPRSCAKRRARDAFGLLRRCKGSRGLSSRVSLVRSRLLASTLPLGREPSCRQAAMCLCVSHTRPQATYNTRRESSSSSTGGPAPGA